MERNLTKGSVWKNVVYFSLPYLLSYFLQTLYGMADLFITGQFNGTDSITAVSIGSQVMHMLTVMIVGLAMGATVNIAQAVGANRKVDAGRIVGNTVVLFMIVAVVLTGVLLVLVRPIVSVMSTPEAAVDGAVKYLTICFIGIPFITAYNIISSIFRGLGDSKQPMYFVAIACVVNIILDYIFIGGLGMGPAGAALGTTISQAVSVAVSLFVILKRNAGIPMKKGYFRPRKEIMGPILRVGLPVSLQDGFIQIAFLLITVIANRRGLTDAAAVGIVEKIISFLFLVPSTMLSTVSALAAQNIGAGMHDRAAQTLKYAVTICTTFGLVIAVLIQFFAEPVVALFDSSPEVVLAGGQYFRGYVWDCVFAGVHFSFSGYFCAYGKSEISFLHNVLSIVLVRIPGAYMMSMLFPANLMPMGFAAAAGSMLSVIVCIIAFFILMRKHPEWHMTGSTKEAVS